MAPVSVVIPCWRSSGTLGRALESVRAQTVPVQEVIVVDDASPDWNASLAKDLRVVRLAVNAGPASARNAGWDAARGELVAFLDADDAWHPRKIELQQRFMREHPELALSGHAHQWVKEGMASPGPLEPGFDEIGKAALLFSNRFTTSSIMLRRELPQRFRDGQRHMEDHLLWLTILCGGGRAARLRAVLGYRYAAPFGEAGQSAALGAMEREELGNYWRLWRAGAIAPWWLALLWPWSLAKFLRRLVIARASG